MLSDKDLQFPNRSVHQNEYQDILNHTTIIDKYKTNIKCLLFPAETTSQSFREAKKLQYITETAAEEIIDKNSEEKKDTNKALKKNKSSRVKTLENEKKIDSSLKENISKTSDAKVEKELKKNMMSS